MHLSDCERELLIKRVQTPGHPESSEIAHHGHIHSSTFPGRVEGTLATSLHDEASQASLLPVNLSPVPKHGPPSALSISTWVSQPYLEMKATELNSIIHI